MPTSPETNGHRRTSHGITCPECGSEQVRITKTTTHHCDSHPRFIQERTRMVTRLCNCGACGHQWWRRSEVSERTL